MKYRAFAAFLLCLAVSITYGWPINGVNTTNLDAATDSPAAARVDLLDLAQKFNDVQNDRGVANGVASLDGNARLTSTEAPYFAAGSASAPSITFAGDTDTGIYNSSANVIAFATGANPWVTIGSTGSISSLKSCATNYTRTALNFCMYTGGGSFTSLTRDSCTAVSVPSGSKLIEITARASAGANNSTGSRYSIIESFVEPSCSTLIGRVQAYGYEFSALTAGVTVNLITASMKAKYYSGDITYIKFTDDSGNQGTGEYYISGYWD